MCILLSPYSERFTAAFDKHAEFVVGEGGTVQFVEKFRRRLGALLPSGVCCWYPCVSRCLCTPPAVRECVNLSANACACVFVFFLPVLV